MAKPCKDCGVVPEHISEERECWACGGSGEEGPYQPCMICNGALVLERDALVCDCDRLAFEHDDQADEKGWAADG